MRRAKIRPSINLAASRRTVPTVGAAAAATSGDRALKSPAKTLPSPVKTLSSVGTTQRSSRSSSGGSQPVEVEKTGHTNATKPASISDGISRAVTRKLDQTQEKEATVQHDNGTKTSLANETSRPSTSKSPSATSQPTVASQQNAKNQEPAAPKVSRGRRKHAPNIPNRGKPRQRPAVTSTGTSEVIQAKETKKDGDNGSDVDKKATAEVAVTEPPPVQRVVTNNANNDYVIPIAISKASRPTISTSDVTPKSSDVQEFQIHQDAPVHPNTSATTKTTSSKGMATPLRNIGQAEKKNPMNIYEKKLRELKETLEEETPAKRRRRYVKKMEPSDRGNMTMSDLIYYNPKNNPMKQSVPGMENRERSRNNSEIVTDLNKDNSDGEDDGQDLVDQFAPQVKIGPDGNLILDQKSLVKDASPRKTFDPSDSDIVHEEFSNTTYASFRKRTRTTNWTKKETEKFYRALSAVGTDFSMINAMFPKRTRQQIKNKFKREERHNRFKVDTAIRKTSKVSMSMFQQSDEDSESETENRPTVKKHKTTGKKRHLSGSTAKAQNQDETESQADGTEHTPSSVALTNQSEDEEVCPSENGDNLSECPPQEPAKDITQSEDSEDDISMETILSRPTRSGRQPKMRTSFTIEEPPTRVYARSTKSVARKIAKPAKVIATSYQQHRLQEQLQKQQQGVLAKRTQTSTTVTTQSSHIVTTPSTSANPRTLSNQSGNVQHIIINSPVVQATPSPIKTHIYVINSPDGSQSIVQVPMTTAVHAPVRSTGSSPIVIHRLQSSQPVSLNVQNTVTTPVMTAVTSQSGVAPQKFVLNPQRLTISPAPSSVLSSLAKSPVKRFVIGPPKVQRRPLVSQNNTAVNSVPRTPQFVVQQVQQQQQAQLSAAATTAGDGADLQQNVDADIQQLSDPVVAQQIDIECYDQMSESGASESGAFVPPVSAVPKPSEHFSGMEQNSDQLMISGLGSEGLSTRDIFDQITYEQGVAASGHGSVAANLEVAISEDMISQIATEIATENEKNV